MPIAWNRPREFSRRTYAPPATRRRGWWWRALWLGLLCAFPARAGSYLDRAALLVTQGAEESRYLRAHLYDKELARMVSHLAAARLEAARNTLVPPEVVQAHPHLLLVLEHYERSANAAVHRWPEKFLVHQRKAEDEELVFRSVLKQSGWTLPELRRSKR